MTYALIENGIYWTDSIQKFWLRYTLESSLTSIWKEDEMLKCLE